MVDPVVELLAHQRRVGIVVWHPSAHNILLSAGSDNKIFLWNCGTGEPLVEIELPDLILSASFNMNGSRVAVTTKDKMLRVLDPRTGEEIVSGRGHQGAKPAQCVYLKDGKIFTTGFSRMSERQLFCVFSFYSHATAPLSYFPMNLPPFTPRLPMQLLTFRRLPMQLLAFRCLPMQLPAFRHLSTQLLAFRHLSTPLHPLFPPTLKSFSPLLLLSVSPLFSIYHFILYFFSYHFYLSLLIILLFLTCSFSSSSLVLSPLPTSPFSSSSLVLSPLPHPFSSSSLPFSSSSSSPFPLPSLSFLLFLHFFSSIVLSPHLHYFLLFLTSLFHFLTSPFSFSSLFSSLVLSLFLTILLLFLTSPFSSSSLVLSLFLTSPSSSLFLLFLTSPFSSSSLSFLLFLLFVHSLFSSSPFFLFLSSLVHSPLPFFFFLTFEFLLFIDFFLFQLDFSILLFWYSYFFFSFFFLPSCHYIPPLLVPPLCSFLSSCPSTMFPFSSLSYHSILSSSLHYFPLHIVAMSLPLLILPLLLLFLIFPFVSLPFPIEFYSFHFQKDLSTPMVMTEIDNSNGVIFPFYDPDTNMIYLCGKGDCTITYYEITDEEPYVFFLNGYKSTEPQRGIGILPKRGVNVNQCEIARFYKLQNNGLCEVIPFTVPRKSELYQDDLYPDTADEAPAISAEDWFNGKDADPVLVSLKEGFVSTQKESVKTVRRSNILDKMPMKAPNDNSQPAAAHPPAPTRASPAVAPTPAPAPVVHTPAPTPPAPVAPAPAPTPVAAPTPAPAVKSVPASRQSANLSNVASNDIPASQPVLPPSFDVKKLEDELKQLTEQLKQQDSRIERLEQKLAAFESGDDDEEEEDNLGHH
ncbi:CORO1B_1C_6 [Acanthosepion pharaonis]|uniref:CORO1B_1C_6 n=1 Tax=Acanthosepion pharaonis TaxID=158019 RepID=A0A812BV77_ACAPH|nr:CORO1B_1C_6 [Sepia pharaonis]